MAGDPLESFSKVVEAIYDCAMEPERWSKTLPLIAELTDSVIATIHFIDFSAARAVRGYDWGTSQPFIENALSTYGQLWAMQAGVPGWKVGRPMHLPDILPDEEFRAGRFYREWVEPQGQLDYIGMVALREGPRIAKVSIARLATKGRYRPEELHLFGLLAPHICRAVRIADALELKTVRSAALESTLDALACAVFLVGFDGRVVHSNRAGEQMARDGSLLSIVGNRLVPADGTAAGPLTTAVAHATAAQIDRDHQQVSIALTGQNGHAGIATLLPLHRGERAALSRPFAAAAAIFVQDATTPTMVPGEALGRLYGLTPAELRVALAMIPGLPPQEIAEILGISLATVKSHLARVFEKTGTTRQADLVALLMRAGPPTLPQS